MLFLRWILFGGGGRVCLFLGEIAVDGKGGGVLLFYTSLPCPSPALPTSLPCHFTWHHSLPIPSLPTSLPRHFTWLNSFPSPSFFSFFIPDHCPFIPLPMAVDFILFGLVSGGVWGREQGAGKR